MREYRIRITELAERDLENVGDYIAYELKNPRAAINSVKGIQAKINSLVNFPERNELYEDEILGKIGIRIINHKNYRIFYLIERDVVYIVRILHIRVDIKQWLYKSLKIKTVE